MSYIGKTPTAVPLSSSDLEDGIITTAKIADDAATADKIANAVNSAITANTSKTTNATHSGEVTGSGALTIADNVVDEANLKVSNSPTNGYNLVARSGNTGGMTWEEASGGGITQADQFRVTSDSSGASTVITSGWERPDTDNYGFIGDGMAQSSGIFTFPVTGRYWVQFRATMSNNSNSLYNGFKMEASLDNGSNWSTAALGYASTPDNNAYCTGSCSFIFNVSNTSTHKLRFGSSDSTSGTMEIRSDTGANITEVTFIRLGD